MKKVSIEFPTLINSQKFQLMQETKKFTKSICFLSEKKNIIINRKLSNILRTQIL